ncbi:hypothetical protein RRG08_022127 [Elysia crispata]|uniref:Uncharacterized protein n=1 Tax=Elysia crispata TaxID=231223 RepID=A0AAE0Y008_9GAST|nr:hypothetical protein RRG08_022127 [Elysia crispata]
MRGRGLCTPRQRKQAIRALKFRRSSIYTVSDSAFLLSFGSNWRSFRFLETGEENFEVIRGRLTQLPVGEMSLHNWTERCEASWTGTAPPESVRFSPE